MNAPASFPRAAARSSVMLRALVYATDGTGPTEHRVVNVSESGLCIGQAEKLKPDTIVIISLGMVDHVAADVVWIDSGLAGLAFHEPIDLQAAKTRPKGVATRVAPAAGWMANIRSPYRS
ncbi:MAG: PilZ domain-containing protein [Sphingomonas bacterium]|nr:PilZ domain-containing protein [Sphingomonas bacterium]